MAETYAALTAEDFFRRLRLAKYLGKTAEYAELIDEIITKAAGAEVSSVKPGNQPSDLHDVFVVVRKLFSQPALFAARFDVERRRLDQRQCRAPASSPQVA